MRPRSNLGVASLACILLAGVILTGLAVYGQGSPGGGKGGGHTEAAVNNLSYPAVLIGSAGAPAVPLDATVHELGKTYSYGCFKAEVVGTTTYPNTSCIRVDGTAVTYLDAAACTVAATDTTPAGPCANLTVDRIYWQKVATNYWKAETTSGALGRTVDFVDWADNLESKSWTVTSTIRVEATPFDDHSKEDPPSVKRGYQMWHVSGLGTDEQWGIRVPDAEPVTAVYAYDSPYSIMYTTGARLNIAKLSKSADTCPATYEPTPYSLAWDGTATTSKWVGACTLRDIPFTAELNVGGKYVYGYNWTTRRDALSCAEGPWQMAGWWRLTFYTPAGDVVFSDAGIPLTPPPLPASFVWPPLEPALAVTVEADTGPLYLPKIDVANNLSYIDICLKAKSK